MHTFPLFRSVRWYAYHTCLCHSLAFYASLHTCLHVLAWVLLDSVSSMLQHDEAMDIWSKPTFVPHRQHPWLFAILLCFPFCSYPGFSVCHVFHVCCFMPFCCALCIFPFNGLSASFFVFAFACMHMKQGCMELGHGLPGASKRCEDVSMQIWAKWLWSVGLGV